jgi:hypothetical protein
LLFSGAEIDWDLHPKFTKDIPDITLGEELFSDGELLLTSLAKSAHWRALALRKAGSWYWIFRSLEELTPCKSLEAPPFNSP